MSDPSSSSPSGHYVTTWVKVAYNLLDLLPAAFGRLLAFHSAISSLILPSLHTDLDSARRSRHLYLA